LPWGKSTAHDTPRPYTTRRHLSVRTNISPLVVSH